MYSLKKTLYTFFCAFLLVSALFPSIAAADRFVVQSIRVEGNQRIASDTVVSYVPVKIGETLDSGNTAPIISKLYATGFFSDIAVSHQGSTLIIKVTERATIGSIKISGNKDIEKDKLNAVIKELGLVEGEVYDPAVLEKVRNSLQNEYYGRGRYNATVTTKVVPEARHRVAITLNISEGRIAQVKQVTILGNKAFNTKTLLKQLPLSTTGLLSFFKHDDQYSEQKLEKAVEALRNYYLDRGYLKVKVESTQASLSPNRKDIYITIRITEGELYTLKGFKLAGNLILPEAVLRKRVDLPTGSVFSRKAVIKADRTITRALGRRGYMFAQVNTVPEVDDAKKQVFLTFQVDPGQRVYVRRVTFSGNTRTEDQVLRREARQMEGALASTTQINETKRRLNILGYLQNVTVKTKPVSGSSDQVDLDYSVTEVPAGAIRAGVGYGTNGILFNMSVDQKNFMGTGKEVRVAFDNDRFKRVYSFSYNNPYYTINGIQRGFSVYSEQFTPARQGVSNYTFNTLGGSVFYTIPISSKDDSITLGAGFQHVNLNVSPYQVPVPPQIQQFLNDHPQGSNPLKRDFNQILLNAGWVRYGLDRSIFPKKGMLQKLNLTVSAPSFGQPLKYYKTSYNVEGYYPLGKQFILTGRLGLGYGGGYGGERSLPFFQNYFAGGIGHASAVRGFDTNSLGPRDGLKRALGGNAQAVASVGIIFPNFISPDNLRTTAFVDAGNVYNTRSGDNPASSPTRGSGPIRYAAGLGVEWRVPVLGLLNLSVAKPLNAQPEDKIQMFQFSFGRNF
jgi:outer membrane protein insertion porin family